MTGIDETDDFRPRFGADGLMPVIAVDHASGEVLMLAYMNEEALRLTRQTGEVHYWSRSRQEIWHKGATSGHTQKVVRLLTDCDQDTLVARVIQEGAACHTGRPTCFYRQVPVALPDGKSTLTTPGKLTFTD